MALRGLDIYIYILAMYRPRPEATANGYIDLTCARERTSCREQFVALNYFEPVPPATEVIGHFEEGGGGGIAASIEVVSMLDRSCLIAPSCHLLSPHYYLVKS